MVPLLGSSAGMLFAGGLGAAFGAMTGNEPATIILAGGGMVSGSLVGGYLGMRRSGATTRGLEADSTAVADDPS